ncbi:YbaN family protein [Vibrio sp. JC009]|uniref:YbaN family protein n=1 Tax=Vibrio sp. JC009 TaxID=2912314 RepID=UPI0023B1465A|nr:YbaN family protein [Vibrio sp. JC009]WED24473.1 YbaN family protein [Vibrio sp. JC009]
MKKFALNLVGWTATALGFLGVFLPLLPTVPFILLALYCFSKGSPEFQLWLENNRYLGETVRRIKLKIGLTVAEKWKILIFSWLSIGLTVLFVLDSAHGRIMLTAILLIETVIIVRYRTHRPAAEFS